MAEVISEEWAPVTGFDWYLLSESGKLWSDEHVSPLSGALISGKIKRLNKRGGYYGTWMQQSNGLWVYKYIHHLVAELYIGPRPLGLNVLHKDDNWNNNHWRNLFYGTQSQNIQQAYDNGRRYGNSGAGRRCQLGCSCRRHRSYGGGAPFGNQNARKHK